MRFLVPCALAMTGVAAPTLASAQMVVQSPTDLKHYDVTIRRFDPARGIASGQEFVLPVDSPDEEHAIASTIANAASWPGKVANGRPLSVAFTAVRVVRR